MDLSLNYWILIQGYSIKREELALPLLRDANLTLQARPDLRTASETQQLIAYLLMRRAQTRHAEIEAIRAALVEGEESGMSDRTPEQIRQAVIDRGRDCCCANFGPRKSRHRDLDSP